MENILMKQFITYILLLTLIQAAADVAVTETGSSNFELPETLIEITDSLPHQFTSPDFPRCCKPMKYLLRKRVDKKYLKLLFTDLDFPLVSQLLIYGLQANGTHKESLSAARYIDGAWVRPVVLYEGQEILIEFHPAEKLINKDNAVIEANGKKTFVGFNATFWADDDNWELDKPFTVCPPIADAIQGGRVTVKTLELPLDHNYRFYCVWLLKPVPDSDLQSYVTLEKLTGTNPSVKIHSGLTSASPVLFSSSQVDSPRQFTSKDGFYIELAKAAKEGKFKMTYGVFKTLLDNEECTFKVDGKSVHGFKCEEGNKDYCIPVENKCNTIKDCPSGLDESPETCNKLTPTFMTTESPTTTPDYCLRGRCKDGRCPRLYKESCPEISCRYGRRCEGTLLCVLEPYESCPGEGCASLQKACADGTCVNLYSKCPDGSGCDDMKRTCKNGQCVGITYGRCPEDPCPSYSPIKCDDKCHYESIKCDGDMDCSDGSDEIHCGIFDIKQNRKLFLFFLFILAIPVVCCAIVMMKRCCNKHKESGSSAERQRTNRNNLPRTSGFSPRAGATGNTQANRYIPVTTVVSNDSNRRNTNSSHRPSPFPSSNPSSFAPQPQSDQPSPSAPPSYGEVMDNRTIYAPPTESPPSYSSVLSPQE